MKIQKYKPGKQIFSYQNKNKYYQFHWGIGGELSYKGYYKYGKYINYQENYTDNQGIKYII